MITEIVRTKKRFGELVLKMEHPVMSSHDFSPFWSNLSMTIMVIDKNDFKKRFYSPTIKYKTGQSIKEYEQKEHNLKIKYERWLYEFCGNYCSSKLSIGRNHEN